MFEQSAWKLRGACIDANPEIFFPSEGGHGSSYLKRLELVAKAYCHACPVSGNCLDEALLNDEFGVWGGTTRKERVRLKRRASRVFCTRCRSKNIRQSGDGEICLFCGLSWAS